MHTPAIGGEPLLPPLPFRLILPPLVLRLAAVPFISIPAKVPVWKLPLSAVMLMLPDCVLTRELIIAFRAVRLMAPLPVAEIVPFTVMQLLFAEPFAVRLPLNRILARVRQFVPGRITLSDAVEPSFRSEMVVLVLNRIKPVELPPVIVRFAAPDPVMTRLFAEASLTVTIDESVIVWPANELLNWIVSKASVVLALASRIA